MIWWPCSNQLYRGDLRLCICNANIYLMICNTFVGALLLLFIFLVSFCECGSSPLVGFPFFIDTLFWEWMISMYQHCYLFTGIRILIIVILHFRDHFDSIAAASPLALPGPYFCLCAVPFPHFSTLFWIRVCKVLMQACGSRNVKTMYGEDARV